MNVNISFTKSSDVHLHPATNCPLHISEPTNTWRLFLFLCPANGMVKTKGHKHPDRSPSFIQCLWLNPRATVLWFQIPILWLRPVTHQH